MKKRADGFGEEEPVGVAEQSSAIRTDGFGEEEPVDDGFGEEEPVRAIADDGFGEEEPVDDGFGAEESVDGAPEKKSLGIFGTLGAQTAAKAGREVGTVEAIAENLPVVGQVMDAEYNRQWNNVRRLYEGDFNDAIEATRLARNLGFSAEDTRRINEEAGYGGRNLFGNYTQVDMDTVKARFKELVAPEFAKRLAARQAAEQKLAGSDLNWAQKGIVGGVGATKLMGSMAAPWLAGMTLSVDATNRAAQQLEGKWVLDKNGDPTKIWWKLDEKGEPVRDEAGNLVPREEISGDMAMLKGFAGAGTERFIWMGLGKVAKAAGGALVGAAEKTAAGAKVSEALANVAARGLRGTEAAIQEATEWLGKTALGRGVLNVGKALGWLNEKGKFGSIPDMMVKSRIQEFADKVVGLSVADPDEREEFTKWLGKFVSVKENVELFTEMLAMHLAMKAGGKTLKLAGKGLEKLGLKEESEFNRKGAVGRMVEETVAELIGEERAKKLTDKDLINLYGLVTSKGFTAERAEQFAEKIAGDVDAAQKLIDEGASLSSLAEGLKTRRQYSDEFVAGAKAAAAELRDRVTLDDVQSGKVNNAALNAAEGNVEIAAKVAALAKARLTNKHTQVDDAEGLESLVAEAMRPFAPEARAVKIHDLKGNRDVGAQLTALEELGIASVEDAELNGVVRRDENGQLTGDARQAVNIAAHGTETLKGAVRDGAIDAATAEALITVSHTELGAATPEERAAFIDGVLERAQGDAALARRMVELAAEAARPDMAAEGLDAIAERAKASLELEEPHQARLDEITGCKLTSIEGGKLGCSRFRGMTAEFEELGPGDGDLTQRRGEAESAETSKVLRVKGLGEGQLAKPGNWADGAVLVAELQRVAEKNGAVLKFDSVEAATEAAGLLNKVQTEGLERAKARLETRAKLFDILSRSALDTGVTFDEASFRKALEESPNGRKYRDNHGNIYGFASPDGTLHFNPIALDYNIPIHEYGHLALESMKGVNRRLWERGMELVKGSDYYRSIKEQAETEGHEYSYLKGDEAGICDEALATMIGDRGEKLVEAQGVGAELKAWLKDFWKAFKGAFGLADMTDAQIEKMTLGEFVDAVNAELLRGKEFGTRKEVPLKEKSIRRYDEAEGSGSNGILRWKNDRGRLFYIPVDMERTRPGGKVVLATDDANITDWIKNRLNGVELRMSKSGEIYVKGRNGLEGEMAEIFGRYPKAGQNDGIFEGIATDLQNESLREMTPDQLVEMLAKDRANYDEWVKLTRRGGRESGLTLEDAKLEQHYAEEAEREEAEARRRWEDSGMDLPEYILSRIEEGEPGFDLDWETMREIDHDVAMGRFAVGGRVAASNMGIKGAADAEAMEKAGSDREDIWRKTGWWRGRDGKWRVEIPDISLKDEGAIRKAIGGEHENITRLGELVDAPELFKAYPDLANVRMVFTEHEDLSGALAGYVPASNTIEVYGKGLVGVYDMDKHTRDRYDTAVLKVRDDEFLNNWLSNSDAFGLKHGTFEEEREYAKYQIKRIERQVKDENDRRIRSLADNRGLEYSFKANLIHEIQHAIQRLEGFSRGSSPQMEAESRAPGETATGRYHRVAGEVEARNATRRANMTAEERAATPPWATEDVPESRQIVKFAVGRVDGKDMAVIVHEPMRKADMKNEKKVKDYLVENLVGREYRQAGEEKLVKVAPALAKEYWGGSYSSKIRDRFEKLWQAKVGAASVMEDIVGTTPLGEAEAPKSTGKRQSFKKGATFYRCKTTFGALTTDDKVAKYPCELVLLELANGKRFVYDIVNIRNPTLAHDSPKGEALEALKAQTSARSRTTDSSIAQTGAGAQGGERSFNGVTPEQDAAYAEAVKRGDKAGWNYVSFRDDNIRVDHKWTDGVAKFAAGRAVGPSALGDGKQRYYEVKFEDAVDKIVKAKKPLSNEHVFISETPNVFRDIGLPSLPVMMNQSHVLSCYFGQGEGVKAGNMHGLRDRLKSLPKALAKPMMIIANDSNPSSSVIAIVKMQDRDGHTVIAPVEINGIGQSTDGRITANIVKSAFGKKNLWSEKVAAALRDEVDGKVAVFYVDSNEARTIENRLAREAFNFGGTERQLLRSTKGTVHSISDFGSPVKGVGAQTDSHQFKRWFGGSKVVDANGEPLVVYRRDNDAFTVFDHAKTQQNDAGWLGRGFYFYGDKGEAERATGYGKNLRSFYLKAENPYYITPEEYNRLVEADDPKVSAEFTQRLKDEGYDSVYWNGDLRQEWMVLDSNQVKSATDNIGTFDPGNNDIRFAAGRGGQVVGEFVIGPDGTMARRGTPQAATLLRQGYGAARLIGGARVADDAGRGEQTPGSMAAALERLNQPRTTMRNVGTVRPMSLPLSEMEFLRKYLTGDHLPATVARKVAGGKVAAHTKSGRLTIAADVFGLVDKTDVAPAKDRLKEHGFFRNEDEAWAVNHSSAEVRAERERSENQLGDELLKLADRRARGAEAGGGEAARGVFANELAKIVMEMPRREGGVIGRVQKIGDAVRANVKALMEGGLRGAEAANQDREAANQDAKGAMAEEARRFLEWASGGGAERSSAIKSDRELTDEMFASWLTMPEEMSKLAPTWHEAILRTVAETPKLAEAFKELSLRALSKDSHKAVFEAVRKSQSREVEKALKELEADRTEKISAGSRLADEKEKIIVTFHDTLGAVAVRIDEKTRQYLKARRDVLAEMKRKGATKAEIAAVQDEIDLFSQKIGHLKNRMELSRTAMERGNWNEGRRYMLQYLLLENKATKKWGLTEEDKSAYLDMMRIVETQGRAASYGMDPRQARLALGDMARRLGAEKWARLEEYGREFFSVMEREFLNDPRVERMWGKGMIDYFRTQAHYVTTKRVHSQEELDAIETARARITRDRARDSGQVDDVIGAMFDYAGPRGGASALGLNESAWTAKLKGSMGAKQEVRSATWEKQQMLMQSARRNQFILDLRDALLAAKVEGVRDVVRGEKDVKPGSRYGTINYVENGVRRTLIVPKQIAEGMKTTPDNMPWLTKFHNAARGLMIDWNFAYWNRNVMRNSGSIEKNMPGMHETWLKTVLRVAPGMAPTVDLACQHLARHSKGAAKAMAALFGRDTIFPYIQQAGRMAKLLEDPTAWQERLWDAEARGDTAEVAEMHEDLRQTMEMLKGNMFLPNKAAYGNRETQGFANDMMNKAGFRMVAQMQQQAARTRLGRAVDMVKSPFKRNERQQEYEDVLAKAIAFLHDRAVYGAQRSVEESGLMVKRNVSIAEGERKGSESRTIQRYMTQFFNMTEKGVTRTVRAVRERPGETLGKMARMWVGRFVGSAMTYGLVTRAIRALFGDDEEKAKASPLGEVYGFAKWIEGANRNLSNYVHNHYQTIPLWVSDDGYTTIVLGTPLNDEDSLLAPSADFAAKAFANTLGAKNELALGQMLADTFVRPVTPDLAIATPALKVIRDTVLATMVENPTDLFTGAPTYDKDLYALRNESWETRGDFALAMARQVWNDVGARGLVAWDRNGVDNGTGSAPKWIGLALKKIPIISPVLNSFVKVQVGSPERDAKPIRADEQRLQHVRNYISRKLMSESSEAGGALNQMDPQRYEALLEGWQGEYGLSDHDMRLVEKRFLNGWREYENEEARRRKVINSTLRKARKMGIEEAERYMIRGDL